MNRLVSILTLVACAGLVLAGCAPRAQWDRDLSSELQNAVVTVAEFAAAGDLDAALAELDVLEQSLLQAIADSRIDSDRSAQISAAISLVRSDLETMNAQEEAFVPTPAVETPITNDSPADTQPGNDKPDKPDKPDKKDEKGKGKND